MGNRLVFPNEVGELDPSWTAPLEMVQRALQGGARLPSDEFFDVEDFMIMARIVRRGRPDLQLYKHVYTRRYVNVDPVGHTYRYHPPRDLSIPGRLGSYRPYKSLRPAIENLRLREMPWLKASLEHHRRGVSWNERWRLCDDETGDLLPASEPPWPPMERCFGLDDGSLQW